MNRIAKLAAVALCAVSFSAFALPGQPLIRTKPTISPSLPGQPIPRIKDVMPAQP